MNFKKVYWGRFAGLLIALLVILLTGCTGRQAAKLNKYDKIYLDYFDTVTEITVYTEREQQFEQIAGDFEAELQRYHQLYDIYHNYDGINNIKTINDNAGITPVTVDRDIIRLLRFAVEQHDKTGGKVNVAMGSVLSIWHNYREAGMMNLEGAQVPDLEQLMRANEHTDIHRIQIDVEKSTVYLPDREMRLDVGAVAKGYAVQQIAAKMKKEGVTSALVSVGGNIQTIGMRGDGIPWRVGVQNPDTNADKAYLYALSLHDMALVTSGSYQRYYDVGGVRYHHIINPDTLMPWNEYVSVTILCPDSGVADVLSTAIFNMPFQQGAELIESMADTEAMWVYPDGTEKYSSGFEVYIDE